MGVKAAQEIRLGDLFVREGLITEEQLKEGLATSKTEGHRIGYALVHLGFVQEEELTRMLARQYRVPAVDLDKVTVDEKILKLIPGHVALKHLVLPLRRVGRMLTVAMTNPTDFSAIDNLKFITRLEIEPVIVGEYTLRKHLENYFGSTEDEQMDNLLEQWGEDEVEIIEEEEDDEAYSRMAGTVPAIRASGGAAGTVLRDDSRGSSSFHVGRFSRGLVVAELAVSCGLLIGAGLANRSVMDLNRLDLGFDVAPVMTARVGLFELDYPDPAARNQFLDELLEQVRSDPGSVAAALTDILPGTGQSLMSFRVEGASYPLDTDVPTAGGKTVSLGYFETFGIEVEVGRDFLPSETGPDDEPVVIVNRAFVDRYIGGGDPLGRRIGMGREELASIPWMRIVGVVSNAYQGMEIFSNEDENPAVIYRPVGFVDPRFMTMAVRARGAPEEFAPQLRDAVARVDPNLPLYRVQSMEAALEEARSSRAAWAFSSSPSVWWDSSWPWWGCTGSWISRYRPGSERWAFASPWGQAGGASCAWSFGASICSSAWAQLLDSPSDSRWASPCRPCCSGSRVGTGSSLSPSSCCCGLSAPQQRFCRP